MINHYKKNKLNHCVSVSHPFTNSLEIFSQHDIDGGLIGGASLNSTDFVSIIESL